MILASQVAWPLQAVIAITFAVPLVVLAWQLQRPAARGLAMGWLWTTIVLLVQSVSSMSSVLDTVWSGRLRVALVCAGIGASVPCFVAAIDAFVAARPASSLQRVLGRSFVWAAALLVSLLLTGALQGGPLAALPQLVLAVGRVVLVVSYALLALYAVRARALADRRFHRVLLMFAAALMVQAMRPFTAVIFFQGADASPLSDPRAMAFLMVNVFISTVFGLACIFVAIEEERAAVDAAARQLRDAALRVERAQRMESVGRLATGVAHDFNNYLMIIKAGAELARDRFTDGDTPDEEMRAIDDAANRGVALTRQLLTFARQQPQRVVEFDAAERVRQMQDLLGRVVGRQHLLVLEVPDTPLFVQMDPSQFEQVLLNLVSNARNALPESEGRIVVHVDATTLTAPRLLDVGELAPGPYATIAVRDTGRGIPDDVLPHIFEPFYTTRQGDGGSGLGLSTVQGIVRQSSGDVTVESAVNGGSTFTVWLPMETLPMESLPMESLPPVQ